MDLVMWLVVGGVAGRLAAAFVPGIGHSVLGDVGMGMIGGIFGGWLFGALGMQVPDAGLPGSIVVAFSGAVVLLFLTRALRPSGRRRFV